MAVTGFTDLVAELNGIVLQIIKLILKVYTGIVLQIAGRR